MVVAFWNRYRERSCRRFAFTRARAALCRSFAALARSRSSCSGARGLGAGGNTARSDGADVGTLSWRGSMAPRTARPGIRFVGYASRNTKIAARPSVRFVKVYVEAYGCTQHYGEARLKQEARPARGPIAPRLSGRWPYCIARVARGRVASYGIDSLVGQVRRHVEQGAREIKLTGQDTAAYGLDTGTNLAALLRAIAETPGEFRVRVGMADPLTVYPIQEELVAAYASDKLFKFLHLPVQSGDDAILESMRRQYTVSEFEEIVRRFRRTFPEITLSTDAIVGFPGESEEQFEATMELVRRVRPDIVNVTRFSPREGTPAATMPGRIVGWNVKERSRRLTRLRFQLAREMNERFIGSEGTVLVKAPGKPGTDLPPAA